MSGPMRIGDILADPQPGRPAPSAAQPDPTPGPGDHADACATCIQVTADRGYYTARPHHVEDTDDGGHKAHYHHVCGARWVTAWRD